MGEGAVQISKISKISKISTISKISKISKNVKNLTKFQKFQKSQKKSKILKNSKISKNFKNFQKSQKSQQFSKISKISKISSNVTPLARRWALRNNAQDTCQITLSLVYCVAMGAIWVLEKESELSSSLLLFFFSPASFSSFSDA